MKKILVSLLLISVLMIPTAVMAQQSENSSQPAAVVNGEKITSQELSQRINTNRILQQVAQIDQQLARVLASSEVGNKVFAELKEVKLNNLINNVLLQQKIEEEEITLSKKEKEEAYQERKQALMQQGKMNEKKFKSFLKEQGYKDEAEYKQEFSSNPGLKINKLLEKKVISKIKVEDQELKQAYNQSKAALKARGNESSFKDLKPQLKEMVKRRKRNEAVSNYLDNLRENAEIEKNI